MPPLLQQGEDNIMAQVSAQSPILGVPVEVRGIIVAKILRLRDLCSLALTCKSWNETVNPKLYTDFYITVSKAKLNLTYLENLLCSAGESLSLISGIHIVPPHGLVTVSKHFYSSYDRLSDSPVVSEQPSETFNTLLRLFLRRMPKGRLKRFIWSVNYGLDHGTITLLLQTHGSSLVELNIADVMASEPPIAVSGCLEKLVAQNAGLSKESKLTTALLASNRQTVSYLTVGDERKLAGTYPYVIVTSGEKGFLKSLKNRLGDASASKSPVLALSTLRVIGADPNTLLNDSKVCLTSFTSLTNLVLESCSDLLALFPVLVKAATTQCPSDVMKLRALTIRQENSSTDFRTHLETFLSQLDPLTKLCIMLEGEATLRSLRSILAIHGANLRCLVWDEREGQRVSLAKSRVISPDGTTQLQDICRLCPRLVELGVTVDWSTRPAMMKTHQKVIVNCLAQLKNLTTINIRNMPEINGGRSIDAWMSPDTVYSALSSGMVERIAQSRKSTAAPLTMFALGALTYGDVWNGSTCQTQEDHTKLDLADALRLRVYHIEYHVRAGSHPTPVLTRVAIGACNDIGHLSDNLEVFEPYWLR